MLLEVSKAPQQTWRLLHQLADTAAPELRAIFLQAVAETVNGVVLPQVSAALARGDLAAAEALIPWDDVAVSTLHAALPEALRGVVTGAATIASNGLARTIPETQVSIRFDLVNERAVAWAEARAAELVVQITEAQRESIRAVIVRGQRDGLSPDAQAREIRSLVGLTERDATAVQNLRARLVADERKPAQVERMTERYADRLLAHRGELIARTETMTAANTGNRLLNEEALAQGLLDRDSRQFWLITPDSKLCPYCREIKRLNAEGVPIGRPFRTPDGAIDAPPSHPSCVPGDTLVLSGGPIAAQSERRFDGDLVVVCTASGKRLACTPNHPVLTNRGWIPARLAYEVGHVISSRLGQGMGSGDQNNEYVPASIEEIAQAFRCSRDVTAAPVPVSAPDFHGDGEGSHIAIVWADSLLLDRLDSAFTEHGEKGVFGSRGVGNPGLATSRSSHHFLDRLHAAGGCKVGRGDLALTLSDRHAGPFQSLRIALATRLNSGLKETMPHYPARHPEMIGDAVFGPAALIQGQRPLRQRGPSREDGLTRASIFQRDLSPVQLRVDRLARDSQLARDLSDGMAGPVFADDVVRIESRRFGGHVYNLQTEGGFYIANGIVTHNCRCATSVRP